MELTRITSGAQKSSDAAPGTCFETQGGLEAKIGEPDTKLLGAIGDDGDDDDGGATLVVMPPCEL